MPLSAMGAFYKARCVFVRERLQKQKRIAVRGTHVLAIHKGVAIEVKHVFDPSRHRGQ